MLKWFSLAPLILLAACSRSEVPTGKSAPVGYAQPARVDGRAAASAPDAATQPAPPGVAGAPEPVARDQYGNADRAATAPAPVSAPASAAPLAAVIPSGTPLHVRVDESIDTRRNRAGDAFSATLSQPVEMNGRVLIPAGTEFRGHVTTSNPSGRLKGRASLGLALDTFHMNGRSYRITTTSVERVSAAHKKRNSWIIGGTTGLGAALGAIAGGGKGALIGAGAGAGAGTAGAALTGKREVGIGAETPLRFTLRSAVEL